MTMMEEEAVARTEAAMKEAGVPLEEHIVVDYFACDRRERTMLPDGRQWVEHKELTEGEKRKYQNSVNRDITIQRATGDARMKMAPGDERHALLKQAIVAWQVFRGGVEVPFTAKNLEEFLEKAPPKVIDIIEKDVRKLNPWLLQEMSVEDIDREIAQLQELRETKAREEEGKAFSNSK